MEWRLCYANAVRGAVFVVICCILQIISTVPSSQNKSLYIKIKEGVKIQEGVDKPIFEQSVSSQTERFMHCQRYECYVTQIVLNGTARVCSLFNFIENVSSKLTPREGGEVFRMNLHVEKDCLVWYRLGKTTDGVYWTVIAGKIVQVYCDMTTNGGGWTVFQRRMDGSVDFEQNWDAYKDGFGDLDGEHWLGNEKIHHLTTDRPEITTELLIHAQRYNGQENFAQFEAFAIADEANGYRLTPGTPTSGNGHSDWNVKHNEREFQTFDHGDTDECSAGYNGGWWFNLCFKLYFNGKYSHISSSIYAKSIHWLSFSSFDESLKTTKMMIRRKNKRLTCSSPNN